MILLTWVSKIVKVIEAENKMVVARSWGKESMENCYSAGITF